MTQELSTAKFIALLSLRVDLGKPRRIPDPLPKAKEIVISDWPRKNAQLLLRLMRALSGRDEVFSLRDVEGMSHETLSLAFALTMAGIRLLQQRPVAGVSPLHREGGRGFGKAPSLGTLPALLRTTGASRRAPAA